MLSTDVPSKNASCFPVNSVASDTENETDRKASCLPVSNVALISGEQIGNDIPCMQVSCEDLPEDAALDKQLE